MAPKEYPYNPAPTDPAGENPGHASRGGMGGLIAKACMIIGGSLVLLLFGIAPPIGAYYTVQKHHNWDESLFANCKGYPETTRYCTEGDPLTPHNVTRYKAWGGCPAGYKNDTALDACGLPCISKGMIHVVENFGKTHDYKLVKFPSRKHPGVNTVDLTAWWLPCGKEGAPRIVLQHGNNANFFSRYVMLASYLLRSIGFDVIIHNLRNHGSSGVSEPVKTTWGYEYPFDLLGAWDYAVNDPDGKLGGKRDASKVGIMGFSMGGFIAASAFGLERDVPAAWTDGAVFDIPEQVAAMMRNYIGVTLASLVGKVCGLWLPVFAKVDVFKHEPATTLPRGPSTKRPYMVAYSSLDTFVPIDQSQALVAFLKKYPEKYKTSVLEEKTTCNDNAHCSIEMAFGDEYRHRLCQFWTSVFGLDMASCQLDTLPSLDNGYSKNSKKETKKETMKDIEDSKSSKKETKKEAKKDIEDSKNSKKETKKETMKDIKDSKNSTKETKKEAKKDTEDSKKSKKEAKKETMKDIEDSKNSTTETKKEAKKDTEDSKISKKETKKETMENIEDSKNSTTETKEETKKDIVDSKNSKKDTMKETMEDIEDSKNSTTETKEESKKDIEDSKNSKKDTKKETKKDTADSKRILL